MPSTLEELTTVVTDALGASGEKREALAGRGVNYGQLMAALLFDPRELQVVGNLTVHLGDSSVSLVSLTNLLTLISLYNSTAGVPVWVIPYDKWKIIVPTLTGNVVYVSRWGNTLYTYPTPTVDNILLVSYRKYPTVLTTPGQELDFDNYDGFITSFATKYAWACLEETESSDLMSKIAEAMGVPFAAGTKIRQQFEEVIKGGYLIQ